PPCADRDRRAHGVDARVSARDPVSVSRARRYPVPSPRAGAASGIGRLMTFNLVALPVRRPTATSMFFLALVMLGLFAWYRIPVELMPALRGEQLVVSFVRPGSEPEVVERE